MSVTPSTVHKAVFIRPLFECDKCGYTELGFPKIVEGLSEDLNRFKDRLTELVFEDRYLPMDWSVRKTEEGVRHLCSGCTSGFSVDTTKMIRSGDPELGEWEEG